MTKRRSFIEILDRSRSNTFFPVVAAVAAIEPVRSLVNAATIALGWSPEASVISLVSYLLTLAFALLIWSVLTVSLHAVWPRTYRREAFHEECRRIVAYHDEVNQVLEAAKPLKRGVPPEFNYVWIDFILSDLRRALEAALGTHGIKVTLFLFREKQQTLQAVQTSEFVERDRKIRFDPNRYAHFAIGAGFTGVAFDKKTVACGSHRRWPLIFYRTDKRYAPSPTRLNDGQDEERQKKDKTRSFLAIPLSYNGKRWGVLSIDSADRRDFLVYNTIVRDIVATLAGPMECIARHVSGGRFDNRVLLQLEEREEKIRTALH